MLLGMTAGDRVRLLRAARNVTGKALAAKARVHASTLARLENNRVEPRSYVLDYLASALEVSRLALDDDAECMREIARVMGISSATDAATAGQIAAPDDRPVTHRELREILRAELHRMGEPRAETMTMGEDAEERQ